METKKADNRFIKSNDVKKDNRDIDMQISNEQNRINKLDSLEESIYTIKNDLNNIIEMLGKSIKGGNITNQLNDIETDSYDSVKSLKDYVVTERNKSESKIRELYKEKEKKEE